MALPKAYIDGHLLNWGEDLFYRPKKPRQKGANSPHFHFGELINTISRAKAFRAQVARTVRGSTEVMVKITSRGGSGKGMNAISNHLDYITRNGKIELEDHEGNVFSQRAAVKYLKEDWSEQIPHESSRREAINLVFSAAKGTPAEEVKDAVREYLKQEFGNKHEYVFALHTDTDYPHVHVCVRMDSIRKLGKRLNPRKNDLQRWREGFAQNLRKRGIDANATPRKTRGVTKQPWRQYQAHQAKRLQQPMIKESVIPNIFDYSKQINAWANIAHTLSLSEDSADRALSKEVEDFMKSLPIQHQAHSSGQKINIPINLMGENEIINEHRKQAQYRAYLYQSHYSEIEPGTTTGTIDRMRNLSSIAMVPNARKSAMLLHEHASRFMDKGNSTSNSLRREGSGDIDSKIIDKKTPAQLPVPKRPRKRN